MRRLFFITIISLLAITTVASWYFHLHYIFPGILLLILIFGIYNSVQAKHTILRNFPVLGYIRYLFEFISPEIQQYFIERSNDGRPFSRNERTQIYQRSKNIACTVPFGTQRDINSDDYEGIKHSIYPKAVNEELPRVIVGGPDCKQPYSASLFNISAMSFGALSENAVKALNLGAKKGGFYHNTGEGGVTSFHLLGGDVVWQIGTGYFGCRDSNGDFDDEKFAAKAANPLVKMIELKISQGAKPGHGGVLPAVKNTPQIAEIRGIVPNTIVLSPPGHSTFSSPEGLVDFIARLRKLSGGKPVGFKLCIGITQEFKDICSAMIAKNCYPDFITVDGAEGGTGAAPLEFSDGVGMPFEPALIFVNQTLVDYKIRDKIRIIGSGKITSGYSVLRAIALGADLCNSARGFMFSLGCIQALRCNNNQCPTGVATQDKMLMKGLVVGDKSERVYHYHKSTLYAANELLAAAGKSNYAEVDINIFMRGDEFTRLSDLYFPDILHD